MILNAFANLNSNQTTRTKRCSNLKNKRSSRLSRLNSWKTCFLKAWIASNFTAGKMFLLIHSNLNGKIWRTRKDSAQSPQTQWKIPGIKSRLAIAFSITSIKQIKFNMPGSRQLHTVLLISKTFASRRHQQQCCASAKIQARNSNESDFAIWVWNQISFS